jgi:polyisoprenyl-phosphate glycosyltransferase
MSDSFPNAKPQVTALIPVYGSGKVLETVVHELIAVFERKGINYECILVNDASPHPSCAESMEALFKDYPETVRCFYLRMNVGQHAALLTGLLQARADWILTLDDDGQHEPQQAEKLLVKLELPDSEHSDLYYGQYAQRKHNLLRNIGSQLVLGSLALSLGTTVVATSFRLFRRNLIQWPKQFQRDFILLDAPITWQASKVEAVLVEHAPTRLEGSRYTMRKLIAFAFGVLQLYSGGFGLLLMLLPTLFISLLGLLGLLWFDIPASETFIYVGIVASLGIAARTWQLRIRRLLSFQPYLQNIERKQESPKLSL